MNRHVWVVFRLRAPQEEVNLMKRRRRGEGRGCMTVTSLWLWPSSSFISHCLTEDLSTWLPSRYPTYLSPSLPCFAQHKQLGGLFLDPELIATLAAYKIRHPGVLNWLRPYFPSDASASEQSTCFLPVLMKIWGGCSSVQLHKWGRVAATTKRLFSHHQQQNKTPSHCLGWRFGWMYGSTKHQILTWDFL